MSFVEGFRAGSDVVGEIQNAILAKKIRETAYKRYADETAYKRSRDTVADTRYGAEQAYLRGRDTMADTRYDEQTAYARGRDKVSDARDARDFSARQGDKMMDDLQQTLRAARDNRRLAAEIEKIQAQSEYYRNGGSLGTGRPAMGYDEYGPDGELVKRRVPVGAAAGAPAAGEQDQLSPEAQEIANRIGALQKQIGKHKVQMAQGDNRTGFLNLSSRQGRIADADAEIAKLRQMQDGGAQSAPVGAPAAPLSPEDARMLQWAKSNPSDPRAAAILQRAGAR